jgi:carboxyl-terminal processing protease
MKFKKLKLILPLTAFLGFALFALKQDFQDKNKLILQVIMEGVENLHYTNVEVNNDFSEKIFDLYLERLDYNKRFFIKEDIDQFEKYRFSLDEQIKSYDLSFFQLTKETYLKRVLKVEKYYTNALKKPFSFTENEEIELDPEKMKFAENEKQLAENWRLFMKYLVLEKLYDKVKIQEQKLKSKDSVYVEKSMEELEIESRKDIKKTYDDWFHRISKIDENDLVSLYFNAIVSFYDPHTQYFPPKDKEDFDIRMSGKLEGIGAQLTQPNAYIKVSKIIPGSPCWKQGELKEGDLILKVAQGTGEPVDVVDMRLDEAIKMIRGKKGTEVRLTVKKPDGTIKIIPIIRDIVILEETFAKSIIINSENGKKYGFIFLPEFYADFNDRNGRQCGDDVKKEIEKLNKEKVDGIIFDLRNNGGGSLSDAIEIVGLFIDNGPVVQVRERNKTPEILKDYDAGALYNGPLVIMTNEFSASASEIMAAAIQDYKRGIIVGSNSYGKGTVQRFYPFDRMVKGYDDLKPLGDLKITTQKFYRINGGSTQLKGVLPDISLPDAYEFLDMGEKDNDFPIGWDEITKAEYKTFNPNFNIQEIRNNSQLRIKNDSTFNTVINYSNFLKDKKTDTKMSLNYEKFVNNELEREKEAKNFENINKVNFNMNLHVLKADSAIIYSDSVKTASLKNWIKDLKKDIYLNETVEIIKDMK